MGYENCNLLDIGGGFTKDNFVDATVVINNELNNIRNLLPNINVIAEPGRYFVEEVFTFFIPVIGYRYRDNENQ